MRSAPADRTVDELCSFGVINLDKPPGPSAHEVTAWIRDMVGADRAAHGGTLDPKVTGCLPILLGDAVRFAQIFHQTEKEYVAVLELHDTPTGNVESVISEFEANLYQKPPKKSAVSRELRTREVYECTPIEIQSRKVLLRIRCESGTYIRKLCHDIGLALGTGAHMGDLRRTTTGPFDDRSLVTMQEVADGLAYWREGSEDPPINITDVIAPAEAALTEFPTVTIARSAAQAVQNGAQVYAPGVITVDESLENLSAGENPTVVCKTKDGTAVCLGTLVGSPDDETGTVVKLERVLV
ncbi:RNA-guided pseudouridylation complex pseudouridine synthase subunit Cbf5 [Salinarchaeum sp. IM2453]|uniref:RNA-guided pseudouridylation complex pseudouridine synthase subunit Cbf5 n=1 Tax=Salinarchaeum sp. IM2453 TaxID=2862870 RepID=UPI0037C87A29